jgi:hypothetical protein
MRTYTSEKSRSVEVVPVESEAVEADFPGRTLSRYSPVFEVGLVIAIGFSFVRGITKFGGDIAPAGSEFENNSGWIGLARTAILEHHQLPLWNHYLRTGLPYLADPLSHLFSPLALFPALALGPLNGPRLAMALTIVAAGLTQYYLCYVFRLSAPARVFGALVYMMNGHMLARFGLGHFDFGLAFPFVPLSFALLYKTITSPGRTLYPICGGMALAGLLFAGNVYYLAFSAPALLIATLLFAVQGSTRRRVVVDLRAVARAGLMASIGAGLSAVQWLAWVENHKYLTKGSDVFLTGSPTVAGALHTLFESSFSFYEHPGFGMLPGYLSEYYSYIGVYVAALIIFAPISLFTGRRLAFLLAILLFAFYVLWASAAHSPFQYVYKLFPSLYDFRWTSRQMALAMPWAALLAALVIDATFDQVPRLLRRFASIRGPAGRAAIYALMVAGFAAFSWIAIGDLYRTTRQRVYYAPRNAAHIAIGQFLAQDADRPFLFDQSDGVGGMPVDYQHYGLKKSLANWGWELANTQSPVVENTKPVLLRPLPRYWVLLNQKPDRSDVELLTTIQGRAVYRVIDAPPYASFVRRSGAAEHPELLREPPGGSYLDWPFPSPTPASADWPDTNSVRAVGSPGESQDLLLVLESYLSGWRVDVDGRGAGPALNVGGLIGAVAQPGEHTYLFVFDPAYARRGVLISLLTLCGCVGLLMLAPMRSLYRRLPGRRRL